MTKKPRADSKLKTLPEDRQAAIAEYASGHTLSDTVKWLREDGLATSSAALSGFLSWYSVRQQFLHDEETTDNLLEQLKKQVPALSEEQLDQLGQRTFSLLSIRRQDPDAFIKVRSARERGILEREKIKLRQQAEQRLSEKGRFEREKWEVLCCDKILKAASDSRTREIAELNVPNEEKIKLLRSHWFKDVDELEKSGSVKLPE